jgi:hypothetical protein
MSVEGPWLISSGAYVRIQARGSKPDTHDAVVMCSCGTVKLRKRVQTLDHLIAVFQIRKEQIIYVIHHKNDLSNHEPDITRLMSVSDEKEAKRQL